MCIRDRKKRNSRELYLGSGKLLDANRKQRIAFCGHLAGMNAERLTKITFDNFVRKSRTKIRLGNELSWRVNVKRRNC